MPLPIRSMIALPMLVIALMASGFSLAGVQGAAPQTAAPSRPAASTAMVPPALGTVDKTDLLLSRKS